MIGSLSFLLFDLVLGATIDIYPPEPAIGVSNVQYAVNGPFDGPKADRFNDTTYQWWYFDAFSADLTQSVVVTFFIGATAAAGLPPPPFNAVEISLQFSNGSSVTYELPAGAVEIATVGDSASGHMNGTGYSWIEAPDLSYVVINIEDEVSGISGTIRLNSDAPPHAVCGPVSQGASLLVVPHLGWGNAIPDASATVNLVVNGEDMKYDGVGYHDSDWGDTQLPENMTWYWGHARVGPYSFVWSDVLDFTTGQEHQSGYVAIDGSILSASCGTITVRPTGANSTYPPLPGAEPSGFHVVYNLGDAGILDVNVTNQHTISYSPPQYARWVGNTAGGIRGQETYTGVALYEWMGG